MEKNRKRPEYETAEEFAGKRPRTPATYEEAGDDEDDVMAWLSMDDDEETLSDLSKLLETEISSPVKVKFIDDPYSSPLIFQSSSSSYITINGNEESCGSSFSDLDSSVMVSVDMGGIINIGPAQGGIEESSFAGWFAEADGGAWGFEDLKASEKVEEANWEGYSIRGMSGSDCCDYDDDMLARFLGDQDFSESSD